jgi:high-affinity Fe2+/Pb2+ permease
MGLGMNEFSSGAMTLAMLAAMLLAGAGVKLTFKRETRSRGILMVVAAAVLVTNVLIWSIYRQDRNRTAGTSGALEPVQRAEVLPCPN